MKALIFFTVSFLLAKTGEGQLRWYERDASIQTTLPDDAIEAGRGKNNDVIYVGR